MSRAALLPLLVLVGAVVGVTALSTRARLDRAANDAPPAQAADAVPVASVAELSRRRADAARSREAAERRRAARRRHVYRIVRVRRPLALRTRPRGPVAASVTGVTEFGSPGVATVGARKGPWLGLVTTARPNNRLGWVRRDDPGVGLRRVAYSLHADLSARRLVLRRRGRRVKRLRVAVGRPGASTPTGRFAITDKLNGSRYGSYYGCCILALSGTQPNLPPGWTGGNRLAIHGTNSPGTIGQAASAGCLRASDSDLAVLMRRVPLGTPVFIRR